MLCADSLVAASGVCGLLAAVASLAAEPGLWALLWPPSPGSGRFSGRRSRALGAQASVAAARGFGNCGAQAELLPRVWNLESPLGSKEIKRQP